MNYGSPFAAAHSFYNNYALYRRGLLTRGDHATPSQLKMLLLHDDAAREYVSGPATSSAAVQDKAASALRPMTAPW
jgi:hypothetical protein